jgi:hypothetical protein
LRELSRVQRDGMAASASPTMGSRTIVGMRFRTEARFHFPELAIGIFLGFGRLAFGIFPARAPILPCSTIVSFIEGTRAFSSTFRSSQRERPHSLAAGSGKRNGADQGKTSMASALPVPAGQPDKDS